MAMRRYVTLAAGVAQTVTVTGRGPIRVINFGVDPVYCNVSGGNPVVPATLKGNDTYVVGPSGAARIIGDSDNDGSIDVSAICVSGPDICVEIAEKVGEGW